MTPVEPLCQTCGRGMVWVCMKCPTPDAPIFVHTPRADCPEHHPFLAPAEAPHEPLSVEEARLAVYRADVDRQLAAQQAPGVTAGDLSAALAVFEAAVRREAEASLQARIEELEHVLWLTARGLHILAGHRGYGRLTFEECEHPDCMRASAAVHPTDGGNR